MNSSASIISKKFGIEPLSIYKCKYYYVVHSQKGSFSLSIARPSTQRIEYINYYKELMSKYGFYSLDNYVLSLEQKPYVEYNGDIYTLCKYYGSSELDILNNIQVSIALETIGNMSKAINEISYQNVYAANTENKIISNYEKQLQKLLKAKKQLSYSNQFDLNIKYYISKIIEKATTAINNLKSLDYGSSSTICHNSLKEGNIIYNKGKAWIIDWDNMRYGHFLEDYAFFIKRYIRKNAFYTDNTLAKYMDLSTLLSSFSKSYKLSQTEYDILEQLLNYPHRFASLIIEYCSKNRAFVPSGLARKIEECMSEWDFKYKYIE